jgi:hypothetical protein
MDTDGNAQVKITLGKDAYTTFVEVDGQQIPVLDWALQSAQGVEPNVLHITTKCQGLIEGTCRVLHTAELCPYGYVPPAALEQAKKTAPRAMVSQALADVDKLRAQNSTLMARIDEAVVATHTLQNTISQKDAEITHLKTAVTAQEGQVAELQATVAVKDEKVAQLQADVDAKALEIADLKKQLEEKGTVTSK